MCKVNYSRTPPVRSSRNQAKTRLKRRLSLLRSWFAWTYQGADSRKSSLKRVVVSHQSGLVSGWSHIRVVSSGWSFIGGYTVFITFSFSQVQTRVRTPSAVICVCCRLNPQAIPAPVRSACSWMTPFTTVGKVKSFATVGKMEPFTTVEKVKSFARAEK